MGLVVVEQIEKASWLDPVSNRLQSFVRSVLRPRWLRDVLHGVWLGHPVHPVLVQVPIGAWLSAATLDLRAGNERAATTLVAVGNIAAVPAAVAGVNDWASLSTDQRRIGLFHWASNGVAVGLFTASLVARLRGGHKVGRRLTLAGLGAAAASAYLGGHLAYREAAGVNHAAPLLRLLPSGWQDLGQLTEFAEGEIAVRQAGGVPVVVYRNGDRCSVLLEACGHHGGPLGRGEVIDVDGQRCVVCPWHGSTFRLADGSVVHGPAGTNQPALQVRLHGGRVQVRHP
jgi:nitrite reductase/ring-hydroxylating ferredoxin subunit